jgi:exodeoxyribonuclease VIII
MIDFRIQPPGYDQGIYDIGYDEYRAIPALNSSRLKHLAKTPAHFKAAEEQPQEDNPPARQTMFDIGTAFDMMMLEGGPDALEGRLSIEPTFLKKDGTPYASQRSTNDYKEWRSRQPEGNLILTPAEYKSVKDMCESVQKKTQFTRLFEKGVPHRVLIWQCPRTGLWCKAEIDWITDDGIIVDLKSAADCGFWFFSKNARKLGYVNQGMFYAEGLTRVTGVIHNEFLLAVAEKEPPFESHVFVPTEDQKDTARDQNEERMDTLLHCLETDTWPGYPDFLICLESGQYFEDDLSQWEEDDDQF